MKVYVDCDVAVKLAQWGLLQRFTAMLSTKRGTELYTVATLKYKFKLADPAKAAAMVGSAMAVQQLMSFVAACKPPLGFSQTVAEALVDVPSIDSGEATLFAAAGQYDAALVDTGDKKALRALGALDPDHLAARALAGKLACLEQTVRYLTSRWTFEVVQRAVASHPAADASVRRCFAAATEAEVLSSLDEMAAKLRSECSNLLASDPFGWLPG